MLVRIFMSEFDCADGYLGIIVRDDVARDQLRGAAGSLGHILCVVGPNDGLRVNAYFGRGLSQDSVRE